jgi:hypothetical protein
MTMNHFFILKLQKRQLPGRNDVEIEAKRRFRESGKG